MTQWLSSNPFRSYRYTDPTDPYWRFAIVDGVTGQLDERTDRKGEAVVLATDRSLSTGHPHIIVVPVDDPQRVGHEEWVIWNFDGPEDVPLETVLRVPSDPQKFLTWGDRWHQERGDPTKAPIKSVRR